MDNPTPMKEITIAGHVFPVPQPFAEGHTCTAGEAAALNQTFAENVRNNRAKSVKAATDDEGNIPADALATLASEIAEYAAAYEFTVAGVGAGRTPVDPVEKEARKIARELISDAIRAAGRKIGDIDKDKLAGAVALKAEDENIIKLAKKRIADRQKNAETVLEGLDI